MAVVLGFAPVAEAHTDFESSNPANGSVIADPISEIRVRFTAESLVAGEGFVVLTPSGEIVKPEVVVSPDQMEFTLLFDPPLVDGDVGVQWSVRAGDAHPIEGTFSFTTTAVATVIEPEPAAVAESQTELSDATGPEAESAAVSGAESPPASEPDAETQSSVEVDQASGAAVDGQPEAALEVSASEEVTAATSAAAVSMDEFLTLDEGNSLAGPVGFGGRLASQAGSLTAIGVVAFAALVSRRSRWEMRIFVNLVRQATVLTIVGALIESAGLVMSLGNVSDALFGSAGFAVLLRLAGAAGLIASTVLVTSTAEAPGSIARNQKNLVSAGGAFSGTVDAPERPIPVEAPAATPLNSTATFGSTAWWLAGLLALSYVFDGHTVTKGNRLLTAVIDVVHVGGGAIWLGGLVSLLMLSLSRRGEPDPTAFIENVVRFSVVAAVALGAVGVAGLALTVTILDSVSELWTTAWGRLLIAKVLAVAVAMAAGAFNHFVLVPELQAISAHDDARPSFLRTLKIEVAALGVALIVTAVLVAAAS